MNATTLSLRIPVNLSMTEDDFLSIVKSWIDNSIYYKEFSQELKALTHNTKFEYKGSSIEVTRKVTGEDKWTAVKHSNRYLEQEWESFLLFHGVDEKEVIIHISCLGDISKTTSFPYQRLEIIRTFARAGDAVLFDSNFNSFENNFATEEDKGFLIKVMNGETMPVLPVIYVTKFFGSAGYAVDLDTLAKRLEGIAYVVCEPDDAYTDYLRNRVENGKNNVPKNGAVGVYFGGNKIIYPRNKFSSVDGYVMQYVLQAVTSNTNKNYTTQAKFNRDILAEHEALIDEYSVENMSLEEKLREAEEKIAALTHKNQMLTETNEALKATISEYGKQGILNSAETEEFFEGEQYDAVITALETAVRSMSKESRIYELISGILECNQRKNHGIVIFNEIKKIFSSGVNLNKTDMSKLEAVGFDTVNESGHIKLVFKGNDKYMFTLAKTGSDHRGGLNLASEMIKTLSVY